MKFVKYAIIIFAAFFSFAASAEKPISPIDHILMPLVGKRVTAEGLAWGEMDKGLQERLVLPNGVPLYFIGANYREHHKNGRTVRVIGRLDIGTMNRAPLGAQGYTEQFQYYVIDVESIQVIDKVQYEIPKLAK